MHHTTVLRRLSTIGVCSVLAALILGFIVEFGGVTHALNLLSYELLFPPSIPLESIFIVITSIAGIAGIFSLSTLSFILLVRSHHTYEAILWLCVIGATELSIEAFKQLFAIARPAVTLVETVGFAYPSGHTGMIAAFATLTALYAFRHTHTKSVRALAVLGSGVIVILVGISRLALGAHWFFDVLGGLLLGFGVATALYGFSHILFPRV